MDALKDEIARRSEPIEGISALLLFGSRARGTERPDSDLDVAVLPSVGDDPQARRRLQTHLAVALADLAPEGQVDREWVRTLMRTAQKRRLEQRGNRVVDRDALSSRLDALESYLAELRSFQSVSREDDLGDLEQFAAAMAPLLGGT